MIATEKQSYPVKRFRSLNQENSDSSNWLSRKHLASYQSSKAEDLDQTQPMSDPTIGKFSTMIGVSGTSLNQINQFDQDSRQMNTGSAGQRHNYAKGRNVRLAESFDELSEIDSQESEVVFVGSRDFTEKKLNDIRVTKSFQFDDLLKQHKKQVSPKTHKKNYVRMQDYEELEKINKEVILKNKQLQEQNKRLKDQIAILAKKTESEPKSKKAPEFIRNRETRKKLRSPFNLTFAHTSFGNSPQKERKLETLASDRNYDDSQVRATFSTGKQLQKTLQKIKQQYLRRKQMNSRASLKANF